MASQLDRQSLLTSFALYYHTSLNMQTPQSEYVDDVYYSGQTYGTDPQYERRKIRVKVRQKDVKKYLGRECSNFPSS